MAKKPRNMCKNSASLCRKGNAGERKIHCKTLAKNCVSPAARKRAGKKLKAIHAKARTIRKSSPGMKYGNAVKQAAKALRSK